jgi:chromosomal replication initiation ATPase DnaA
MNLDKRSAAMLARAMPVIRRIAREEGFDVEDVMNRSRFPDVVRARHRMLAVLRWSTGWSYPDIGRVFKLEHTTVWMAIHKYEASINDT